MNTPTTMLFHKYRVASPFWLFVLSYAYWGTALFGLIYIEDISPLIVLSNMQTELSIYLTKQWIAWIDIPVSVDGAFLLFEHGLKLEIVNQCNGLAAFLLFFAATLAYPTHTRAIVRGAVLAYAVILAGNIARLCLITMHVVDNPQDFVFAHEVLGRYALALLTLIIFYRFVKNAPLDKRLNSISTIRSMKRTAVI